MNVVKEFSQLKENINTLESYLKCKTDPEYSYAVDLIKRGMCFVAVKQEGNNIMVLRFKTKFLIVFR